MDLWRSRTCPSDTRTEGQRDRFHRQGRGILSFKPTQGRYVPTSRREQLPSALGYQMLGKEENIPPPLNSAAAAPLHVSSLLINTGS